MAYLEGEQGLVRSVEQPGPTEHQRIEVKALSEDNKSVLAQQKIDLWLSNYDSGRVFIEIGCSDKRPISAESRVIKLQSVGAGFPHKAEYNKVYNDQRIEAIVVRTHFDGIRLVAGERPSGCGGQDTKAKIVTGLITPKEGITDFVDHNVDQDPLVQSFLQAYQVAEQLSESSCRTVIVANQDHRRGLTRLVGEISVVNGIRKILIPEVLVPVIEAKSEEEKQKEYNPKLIYANGIPELPRSMASDKSRDYLETADEKMRDVLTEVKDFTERQATQNPWALVISTSKIPIENRYPEHFKTLKSPFKVDIPRAKSEQITHIDQGTISCAINQMEYAITKSIENHNNPNADFSDSHVLLIETSGFDQSSEIARQILTKTWMQKWILLPDHQLFVSEVRDGRTLKLDEIN